MVFAPRSLRTLGLSSSKPYRSRCVSTISNSIQNILLVQKPEDARVSHALQRVVSHVRRTYPHVQLFHEPQSLKHKTVPPYTEIYNHAENSRPHIDLVITLGGDGTILHASSLFNVGPVPPMLSFSLGTLGFLLPFHIDSLEDALEDVFNNRTSVLSRMRLRCSIRSVDGTEKPSDQAQGGEVMNEITLHRGQSPHLTSVDTFVDGQHLTAAIADGLIVATPTGSTAYSLSSGGPIVHPSVQAMLLTPVAPMSLSFRPLVLPGWSKIRLQMSFSSRTSAFISMDGRAAGMLSPGEFIEVEASPHPIPCINRSPRPDVGQAGDAGGNNWVKDINSLLGFNTSFKAAK